MKKKKIIKKKNYHYHMKKHKKTYVITLQLFSCTKMNYTYEKASLSGNKNDQVIHQFRIIHQVATSQVYLNKGVSFN